MHDFYARFGARERASCDIVRLGGKTSNALRSSIFCPYYAIKSGRALVHPLVIDRMNVLFQCRWNDISTRILAIGVADRQR